MKLKPSKCHFLKDQIKYLGHFVSQNGIHTDPDKVAAVKSWPIPKNVKTVQQFLGFVGFYRRFIQDFAKLARPLTILLKDVEKVKKKPFVWEKAQQDSFDTLKLAMIESPILSYADYSLPFEVHVDASSVALGAVLCQKRDGKLHVIAYASRCLKPSEVNYSAYKREYLALKWAVTDKFHDYLYGAHFAVWTDNNPLTYVLTSAKLDATGHRWLAKLASFDFSIKYKSGKTNTDADSLSRIPETCAEITKAICNASEFETDFVSCMSMSPDVVSEFESCSDVVEQLDISQLQLDDPDIAKIIEWKRCGHIPSKDELKHVSDCIIRLARDLNKLSFVNNVLVKIY